MFLRGFERDGAKTSGFFKLQKIRTGKNIRSSLFMIYFNKNCKVETKRIFLYSGEPESLSVISNTP